MKAFKFNKHNVCTNPKTVFRYTDKNFYAELTVCESKGKWTYGYSHARKGSDVGCGAGTGGAGKPGTKYATSYSSQRVATEIGLYFLADQFQEPHPNGASTKKIVTKIYTCIKLLT